MLAAFKQSSQSGHLSQTKFQEYIDTMISLDLTSEARSISKQATIAHPTSAGLWLTRLSCEGGGVGSEAGVTCEGSGKGDVERMGELCREALGRVAKEVNKSLEFIGIQCELMHVHGDNSALT